MQSNTMQALKNTKLNQTYKYMKTKHLFLFLIGIATFFQATAQCTAGAVDETVWGSPTDFDLGFTIDANITDVDTIEVVQGTNGTQVMQYLLPKKQAITTPITTTATVNSVQIVGVTGLPVGLSWTLDSTASANSNTYYPQTYRYGAVTVCGTTYANPGDYTLTVNTIGTGSAVGQTQSQAVSFPLYLKVLPGSGGNSAFSFSPAVGCDSLNVDFEAIFQSPNDTFYPLEFNWDFGDGTTVTNTPRMVNHNYSTPGTYPVKLDIVLKEYYIHVVSLSNVTGVSDPINAIDVFGTFAGETLNEISNNNSPSWNVDIPINDLSLAYSFTDADNPTFFDPHDPMGSGTITLSTNDLYHGSNTFFDVSHTANFRINISINQRINSTITVWDTITIHPSSTATAVASSATTFCQGDSTTISISGSYASIQWYNDTTELTGETNNSLVVNTTGSYYAKVVEAGSICDGYSNRIDVTVNTVDLPSITQNASGALEVNNPNGHSIQWLSNGVPIPSATTNTLTDLSSGNPFTVSFTSSTGCTATSAPFTATILQAGTSTQSGNELTPTTPIDFVASGFSMCSGESIAWAVSTQADGAITNMTELQTAINNGWVFPSSSTDSLNLNCGNATFPLGDYFMTPFTAQSYDPNCVPNGKLCMEIEAEDGVGLVTDQLIFTFPDGSTKNIRAIVPANFQSLLPNVIDSALIAALPNVVPGGALCFNLSDLYSGDPNGIWTVSAQNTGTGSVTVTIPTFEVGVYTDSCSAITQNEVSQIPATSETITGGSSGQLSFTINATSHTPPFPTVNANCLLFGSATAFSSTCATSITTIANVENLMVYPNPNNGIFTVEFELDKTEAVAINIIDITGRVVLNREYPNVNGEFKEQFDLKNNLDAGFYVIDINVNGNRTQRKIIVK